MKLFGRTLSIDQVIRFVKCQAASENPQSLGEECGRCLMAQAALELADELEKYKEKYGNLEKDEETV